MEIVYENNQWLIDKDGMVCKENNGHDLSISELYNIKLWETSEWPEDKTIFNAPLHYAMKDWVNIDLFLDAWVKALDYFRNVSSAAVSAEVLERSIVLARRIQNNFDLLDAPDTSYKNFKTGSRKYSSKPTPYSPQNLSAIPRSPHHASKRA